MERRTGYRFHPSDEEIVGYFLRHKILGNEARVSHSISEIPLSEHDPLELPPLSRIPSDMGPWFFIFQHQRSPDGQQIARTTRSGFWECNSVAREIKLGGRVIGTKKPLVFYRGWGTSAMRTGWFMYEYNFSDGLARESDYSIGKLKYKDDLEDADDDFEDADDTDSEELEEIAIPAGSIES